MAQGDLEPPPHRGIQWTDRGSQPVREESEALWSWLHLVPPLSTARTPSCRWCHLAAAAAPIPDQDPRSLLKRVGPLLVDLSEGHRRNASPRLIAKPLNQYYPSPAHKGTAIQPSLLRQRCRDGKGRSTPRHPGHMLGRPSPRCRG